MDAKLKILEKIKRCTKLYDSYFKKDNYIFVTDSKFLVRLNENHFDGLPEELDTKFDRIDRALSVHPNYLDMKLSNDDFNRIYGNIPVTYHHIVCDACKGTGKVDFIFDHDGHDYINNDDCPVCNGSGVLEDEKEDIDPKYYVRVISNLTKTYIDVIYFKYIKELIDAFDLKLKAYNMSDDFFYLFFEDDTKIVILFNSYNQKNKKVIDFFELKNN